MITIYIAGLNENSRSKTLEMAQEAKETYEGGVGLLLILKVMLSIFSTLIVVRKGSGFAGFIMSLWDLYCFLKIMPIL